MDQEKISQLSDIAKAMVAPGKGILAADESMNTVGKRFASINLENTEDNRRAFREMLLTAPGEEQYISGVILFDETIRQRTSGGKSFVEVLRAGGILPGIKVDQGLVSFNGSEVEKITKGLDGLGDRLKEYVALGAKFAKWRAVITISDSTPTPENIVQNTADLAQYALLCQQAGLVPMVEPEVLLDGNHSLQKSTEVLEQTLISLIAELKKAGVALEGTILKSSMAISGKNSGVKDTPAQVAEATIGVFKKVLPKELAGVVFLSGGQSELQATENLNAMHQLGQLPWPVTFSYARALQDGATKTWKGNPDNLLAAQRVFLHRAKMNSLASQGKYQPDMEQGFSAAAGGAATQD
ncbi:MAG: fructose-bisphosphate aldolase class I [Patescibacteria group bacterium]|nr:fructose-bisphosphate aldolase class I [Patescibacteria group bacterium]